MFNRRFTILASFAIALAIPLALTITASGAPRDPSQARSVPVAPLPPIPSPPRLKQPPVSVTGRIDLPYDFERGVIRVRLQPGVSIDGVMAKHGLKGPATYWNTPPFDAADHRSGIDRSYRVGVEPGTEKTTVVRLAPHIEDFEYVAPAWKIPAQLAFAPNDSLYAGGSQGNLNAINMPRAWDRTVSFSAVTVAVIDSGLRGSHQDAGAWKQHTGWDYISGTAIAPGTGTDTGCYGGHGTDTSSIAAGDTNNGVGVAGTGFNSGIMPIKYIGSDCFTVAVSRADPIRFARSNGAHVINMSYSMGTVYDPDEAAALQEAFAAGVLPVAAAGNNADSAPHYPCANLYTVCVGGSDNSGTQWSQSNFGSSWVDLAAPAINIWGAGSASDSSYIYGSGTSYSAPQVAGIAALMRSLGWDPNAQWNALCSTAHPNGWTLCGFVDAGAALWFQ